MATSWHLIADSILTLCSPHGFPIARFANPRSMARAEAAPAPTPVEPGTVEIRSTVSMTVEVSEK